MKRANVSPAYSSMGTIYRVELVSVDINPLSSPGQLDHLVLRKFVIDKIKQSPVNNIVNVFLETRIIIATFR